MTPCQLLRSASEQLRQAGIPDPETDSALLLSFLCGRPPLALRLDTDTDLSPAVLDAFAVLAERRLAREPLQYILREAPFCGRMFFVDPRVLIPRPETELLCRWALDLPLAAGAAVLDLCCGSGCIGLTLSAERPDLSVTLSDLSRDALDVSAVNAGRLGLCPRFCSGDLTAGMADASFDLIVSNPPYIPSADCAALQPEVLREPVLALDGGADGLDLYRRIIADAPRVLKERGLLLLELGYGEAGRVAAMLEQSGFANIEVRKDYSGIERMILASAASRRSHD